MRYPLDIVTLVYFRVNAQIVLQQNGDLFHPCEIPIWSLRILTGSQVSPDRDKNLHKIISERTNLTDLRFLRTYLVLFVSQRSNRFR